MIFVFICLARLGKNATKSLLLSILINYLVFFMRDYYFCPIHRLGRTSQHEGKFSKYKVHGIGRGGEFIRLQLGSAVFFKA